MNAGDSLLYVLSARREISWVVFKDIFDELAASAQLDYDDAPSARRLVLRNLDSLAHCDYFSGANGIRIAATPTCLTRLPTQSPKAVVSGARSPTSIDLIVKTAKRLSIKTEVAEQQGEMAALCPSTVELATDREDDFRNFCDQLGVLCCLVPPSWQIVQFSGTLRDVTRQLEWRAVSELDWVRMDFDPAQKYFRTIHKESRSDLRLTRYIDPKRNTYRYYVWDGLQCATIDLDWGRYFVLSRTGFNVLYFNVSTHTLMVPKTVPLPKLLARAVALCSGRLPQTVGGLKGRPGSEFLSYQFVPESTAMLLADKLGQDLNRFDNEVIASPGSLSGD